MFINRNIKYRDILIFALIGVVGYKIIDNYDYFFSLAKKTVSIMAPFTYALICAYILNPVVRFFEKKFEMKRVIAIALTYFMLLAIVFIGLFFTIPSTIDSILNITKEVPNYVKIIQTWINAILKNERVNELITQAGLLNNLQQISTQVGNFTVQLLQNFAIYLLSFTSNLVNVILGFVISIYVLGDKEKFVNRAKTIVYIILKEKKGKYLINFVRTYNTMVGTYIGIKAIDSSIIGGISLIGLILVKAPYAPLLAVIVGITNMIPYFGPLIGVITSCIVTVLVSPMRAIVVAMLLLAIQQFDAWYLEPRLIGRKVGISPFAIILGVTIGGGFFGPIGMLLSSPTMATIRIYYNKIFARFKENNEELVKKEGLE